MNVFLSTHSSTLTSAKITVFFLKQMGHRTFFYRDGISAGEIFLVAMAEQLEFSDRVVCLLSEGFFESTFCMLELTTAIILRKLIMMKAEECDIPTMYTAMVYIDMTKGETRALKLLDAALRKPPGGEAPYLVDLPEEQGPLKNMLVGLSAKIASFRGSRSELAEAYFLRSRIFRRLGQFDEALEDAETAIELGILEDPDTPNQPLMA